nr:unknown Function [uncultured bacterium]
MASTNHAPINNDLPGLVLLPQTFEEDLPTIPKRGQTRLQKQFDSILKKIKSPVIQETVESVFVSLSRLCGILDMVEINTSEGGPLPVTVAAFSLVDDETKSLIRLIEKKLTKIKSIKGNLRHALDATSFVLRHELKRVFTQELVMLSKERRANQICADVMRAHGLLSNCFQQSILSLAQVFDPSVSSKLLFDGYRDRLEQSNVLIKELSAFCTLARQAEERRDAEASELLIRELKSFCNGSLHYLMYKDWEEFEDIAREVTSSSGSARHGFILHCFVAYLEALINQVRMRAVLNERSADGEEPKARGKKVMRCATR